jgi:hypothetical protein
LFYRRRGVEAHQDVRQRGGTLEKAVTLIFERSFNFNERPAFGLGLAFLMPSAHHQ